MKIIQEPKIISQIFNKILSGGDGRVIVNIITIGTIDVHNGGEKAFMEITENVDPLIAMQEAQSSLIKPEKAKRLTFKKYGHSNRDRKGLPETSHVTLKNDARKV